MAWCHSDPDQDTDYDECGSQNDPQADQKNMNVGVPGTKDRAGGSRQQLKAVEIEAPCPSDQQQNRIGNKMAKSPRIRRYISPCCESEDCLIDDSEAEQQRSTECQ